MGFRRYAVIGGALAALAAGPSLADIPNSPDGPYLRGEAGMSFATDVAGTTLGGPNFTLSPTNGFIGGAALGLRVAPFRVELDIDHSSVGAGSAHFTTGSSTSLSGSFENTPVMANLLYDIDTGTRFTPYLGIGAGVDFYSADKVGTGGTTLFNGSKAVIAFQPMLGVNFALTDQLQAGLQYRYFRTASAKTSDAAGDSFSIPTASHNVLASLTYYFEPPAQTPGPVAAPPVVAPPPPPPPPVAAAPTAPKEFVVYFDFDKAGLTAAATGVIDSAITAYRQNPSAKIVLRGYTDAVGTEAYNLELSKRRALAVSSYMARHGVPQADMNVGWEGKKDLVVQTSKPERLNRRVEIQM